MGSMVLQASLLLTVLLVQWSSAEEAYYIQHTASGQVLEASNHYVRMKDMVESKPSQLWTIAPLTPGKHVITNVGNKRVLDAEFGSKHKAKAITYEAHHRENQRFWFNVDGTIVIDKAKADDPSLALTKQGKYAVFLPYSRDPDSLFQLIPAQLITTQ